MDDEITPRLATVAVALAARLGDRTPADHPGTYERASREDAREAYGEARRPGRLEQGVHDSTGWAIVRAASRQGERSDRSSARVAQGLEAMTWHQVRVIVAVLVALVGLHYGIKLGIAAWQAWPLHW